MYYALHWQCGVWLSTKKIRVKNIIPFLNWNTREFQLLPSSKLTRNQNNTMTRQSILDSYLSLRFMIILYTSKRQKWIIYRWFPLCSNSLVQQNVIKRKRASVIYKVILTGESPVETGGIEIQRRSKYLRK